MRLSKVNKGNLTYHCALCKQEIKDEVYADLDGPSFQSYYHQNCGYNFYAIQAVEQPAERNMKLLRNLITELHPSWNGWQSANVELAAKLEITTLHCDDGDLSVYAFDNEAHFWSELDAGIQTAQEEWDNFGRKNYSEALHEMLYGHQIMKKTLWG